MVYTYDRVGIGDPSPDFTLEINHGFGNESSYKNGFMLKNTGDRKQNWRMYVSNDDGDLYLYEGGRFRARLSDNNGYWYTSSDKRLKTNIRNLSNQIDRLMKLRPTSYEMISDEVDNGSKKVIGFIAQELREILSGGSWIRGRRRGEKLLVGCLHPIDSVIGRRYPGTANDHRGTSEPN